MSTIMDRDLMRPKVGRMLLKESNSKTEGKLTPITKLKLDARFNHDGK